VTIEAMDHLQIQYLLGQYGHLLDAEDWSTFATLFTPDAVLDYTGVRAPKVMHGIDEIVEYFQKANHPSAHHVTNIVVQEVEGEVRVHSKFIVPFTRAGHTPLRWYGGDYLDVVVKTEDGWRFAKKSCRARWQLTYADDDVPAHRQTF